VRRERPVWAFTIVSAVVSENGRDPYVYLAWERPPVEAVESVIRSTYNIVTVGGVK